MNDRRKMFLGSAVVTLLLLGQFLLFRQYVLREVAWSWPPDHDQLNFLQPTYAAYERILQTTPRKGLEEELSVHRPPLPKDRPGAVVLPARPQEPRQDQPVRTAAGLMLPLQATILCLVTGPNRLTALSLNFFYFALFQVVLAWTLRWLTGRWSLALLGIGLLLLCATPFYFQGGITDFRLDFAGFSLFGIFLCLVIRSGVFEDRKWSVAAGAAAAFFFTIRFLALVYLLGTLGLFSIYFIVGSARQRHGSLRRLINLMLAAAVLLLVAVPIVARRFHSIRDYYIVGHVSGPEKQIRAQEQGVTDTMSALLFYPRSLLMNHAGLTMLIAAGILLAFAVGAFIARGSRRRERPPLNTGEAFVFILTALCVPLAVLTVDQARSPVVADVMVPPLLWLVMLSVVWLTGAFPGALHSARMNRTIRGLAAAMLVAAIVYQCDRYGHRIEMTLHRGEVDKLLSLYDTAAAACADMGWVAPNFAIDRTSDSLHFKAFEVMAFERHGQTLRAGEVLAENIFGRPAPEELARLPLADLVVLTEGPPAGFDFPFDQTMRRLKPQLRQWASQNLIELRHEQMGPPINCDATLYVRPAVRVEAEPDGWIAERGATVTALCPVLRARPTIELWGPIESSYLGGKLPRVIARARMGERDVGDVPAELSFHGSVYCLVLHCEQLSLAADAAIRIALEFDTSFVPDDLNHAGDRRRLVVRLPDRGKLSLSREADDAESSRGQIDLFARSPDYNTRARAWRLE